MTTAVVGGGALSVIVVSVLVSRLGNGAPVVDRQGLWIDSVRSGEFVRDVRGPGVLVPEHVRIIAALTTGRVDAIVARPGASVTPGTVLLRLTNPDLQLQTLEAERQLSAARSTLLSVRTSGEDRRLMQEAASASSEAAFADAARSATAAESLAVRGLLSAMEVSAARDRLREMRVRLASARRQLMLTEASRREEVALQQAQIDRLSAILEFHRAQTAELEVRAGEAGVVQEIPIDLGQWVTPGTILARVAEPRRLKAVVHVPETQARDLAVGQRARIDAHGSIGEGYVTRIAPAAQAGTVETEVAFAGEPPAGARASVSVDAIVEIDRVPHALFLGRPAGVADNSTAQVFRVSPDGRTADRVEVRFGRGASGSIEALVGLAAGDRIILSDASQWAGAQRLRLR